MSGQTVDKLIYMVNQIARNLTHDATPAETIAAHITAFWSPKMIADLMAQGDAGLDPVSREAVLLLATRSAAR